MSAAGPSTRTERGTKPAYAVVPGRPPRGIRPPSPSERRRGARLTPHAPSGSLELLRRSLELRAGRDLDRVTGRDLELGAGLRVATGASGTGRALDGEPARDGDLRVGANGLGERLEEAAEHGVDGGLALSGRRCDLRDELGLVERLVSH